MTLVQPALPVINIDQLIEMKTESPVRTIQLWTKPQSEEEYTADQFT
jgi:hypothetical protein